MTGKLYLIPSTIGDIPIETVIPPFNLELINKIQYFIVENERTARRMLLKMGITTAIDDLNFQVLNKHTKAQDIPGFLTVPDGKDIGLLSEAGVPAIADPGSEVVKIAHQKKMEVISLVGPSSILLAMMASGLNGQNFAFVGYIPVKTPERIRRIKQLELRSEQENQSQIFIEAPYRNNQLIKDLITTCNNSTMLCIACNITTEEGFTQTKSIQEWKKQKLDLNKQPTLFILHKYR